ncbi:SET domain-containing protein-lysine N-methyltransferase [Mitsuaria sp. WAJ17]|uniref:SET domain-containing protein n=1 Tax=Mitsuaria sp. WAJ17 TaxID=2761452 RepID=UPI0015FF70EC|nr:SET domain-containing protein-lysine N-methyltransferase [Mitsuaria sp. WAJ17]MBB2486562.1 SET domain-containing protein-lysine N-methyltransferase [Mitsuaria sp. WAJ17]
MPKLVSIAAPEPAKSIAPGSKAPAGPQAAEKYLVSVQPSRIDGHGVFAAEPIPARRKIGEMRGELISVAEARRRIKGRARIHMVEVSERRAIDATESDGPLRYINHSCLPNAVLRIRQGRAEFYAIRDIEPGEELTADYGESHHEGRLRCACGAPNCKGRL